jgi:hypothetical protein
MCNWKIWYCIKTNLQRTGIILLIVSLVLTHLRQTGIALIILISISLIESYLLIKEKTTITNWYRPIIPRAVDMIFAVMWTILIGWHFGWFAALLTLQGGIIYHLCTQE